MAELLQSAAVSGDNGQGRPTVAHRGKCHWVVEGDEHPEEELWLLEWSEGLLETEIGGDFMAGIFQRASSCQSTLLGTEEPSRGCVSRKPPV